MRCDPQIKNVSFVTMCRCGHHSWQHGDNGCFECRQDLIERLIFSGTVTQYGVVKERLYDPLTYSTEGLDDCCFHCGASPIYRRDDGRGAEHSPTCAWVEAMQLLGHDLPEGHAVRSSSGE